LDIMPGFQAKFLSAGIICGLFGGVIFADFFDKTTISFCDGETARASETKARRAEAARRTFFNSAAPQ
jgi:hypothetical protein